jgi:hypothetical protein
MTDGQIAGLAVVGIVSMILLALRQLVRWQLPKRGNFNVLNVARPAEDEIQEPHDK